MYLLPCLCGASLVESVRYRVTSFLQCTLSNAKAATFAYHVPSCVPLYARGHEQPDCGRQGADTESEVFFYAKENFKVASMTRTRFSSGSSGNSEDASHADSDLPGIAPQKCFGAEALKALGRQDLGQRRSSSRYVLRKAGKISHR